MKFTLKLAQEMSIWRWKNFPTSYPTKMDWLESPFMGFIMVNNIPNSDCGLCEYYSGHKVYTCAQCLLYWTDAEAEPFSAYDASNLNCSRNYWHWLYWCTKGNKPRMRYWAAKLLAEIEGKED